MRPLTASATLPSARSLPGPEDGRTAPALLGHLATPHASLLDAVRLPLVAALRADVQLRILRLRVDGGWAFVEAEPQDGEFRPFDLVGLRRQGRVCALARTDRDGRWRAVAYAFDGRPERYARWTAHHGAPAALLPLTWPGRVRAREDARAGVAKIARARAA
jgi:hypothetical protein